MSPTKAAVEIHINMDKPCAECGRDGATQNGLCLDCITKVIQHKPMKSKVGRELARRRTINEITDRIGKGAVGVTPKEKRLSELILERERLFIQGEYQHGLSSIRGAALSQIRAVRFGAGVMI